MITIKGPSVGLPEGWGVEADPLLEPGAPRHEHDSSCCRFLGRMGHYDVYVCPQEAVKMPTLIARFGERGDYNSGPNLDYIAAHVLGKGSVLRLVPPDQSGYRFREIGKLDMDLFDKCSALLNIRLHEFGKLDLFVRLEGPLEGLALATTLRAGGVTVSWPEDRGKTLFTARADLFQLAHVLNLAMVKHVSLGSDPR